MGKKRDWKGTKPATGDELAPNNLPAGEEQGQFEEFPTIGRDDPAIAQGVQQIVDDAIEGGKPSVLETQWADGSASSPVDDVKAAIGRIQGNPGSAPPAGDDPGQRAATIEELEAVCEGAPADWLIVQLKARATMEQAAQAWKEIQANHRTIAHGGNHHGIEVTLPIGMAEKNLRCSRGYKALLRFHLDRQLSAPEARTLGQIRNAYENEGRRLNNGKYVQSDGDAVVCLLQDLAPLASAGWQEMAARVAAEEAAKPARTPAKA
jgi:hypothetical protein